MLRHAVTRRDGRRRPRADRDERGAAAVEFALILPILMALVFGIISFGFMLSFRQAMSQAAAEGARSAAVAPVGTDASTRTADAVGAVNDALGTYGVSCSGGNLFHDGADAGSCTVSSPGDCESGGGTVECVTVHLIYDYQDHSLIPGLGLNAFMPEHLEYRTQVRVS